LAALSVPWTSAPPVPLPSVVAVSIVVDAPEPLPESPVNRTQSVVSAAVAQPVDRADYVPAPPPIERAEAPPPESYPPLNPASVPVAQAAPQPRATLKPVREPAASVRPKAKQVAAASQSQPASESPVPPVEAAAPRAAPVDASPATAPMVVAAAAAPGRPAAAAVAAGPVLPPRPVAGLATNRKPDYPVAARSRHLQGHVVLRVQVSETGDPLAVEVVSSSGHPMLDDAALAAVRTWRFIPASRGGVEVAAPVEVPIDFRMAD